MKRNDFTVKEYIPTQAIEFDFVDDPGDDSKDLRARRTQVIRKSTVTDKDWELLVQRDAVVWRGQYDCARSCQEVVKESKPVEPTLESINLDELDADPSPPKKQPGRKRKYSSTGEPGCSVVLHVSPLLFNL